MHRPDQSAASPEDISGSQVPRSFGLGTATYVVIASMVGTGVLTTSGYTIFSVGSNRLMLALWILGGVVAFCGALTIAELAAALPRSGGDYVFLHEAFGPLPAFLSGWVSFLIGFGCPIAASAFAAAKYFLEPLGIPQESQVLFQKLLATVAIIALGLVHALGRNESARVQGATTIIKLAILGTLAGVGIAAGWGRWSNLSTRPALDAGTLQAMAFSLIYISYAYTGWNSAGYLAGEVRDPQRLLPRAILLGTAIVLVLYLALNLFYALALSPADIRQIVENPANKQGLDAVAPIAEIAARKLFGASISRPLSLAIGLTLLASLSAFILTGPRVAFAMARAGQFPAFAGRLSPSGTPALATGLQVAWALVMLWSGSFESIIVFASVGLALFSMLTIASIFALRARQPDLPRPFKTPGYPYTPAFFLLVTGLLTAAAFSQRPWISLYALLSILAGVPVYFLWVRKSRSAIGTGN